MILRRAAFSLTLLILITGCGTRDADDDEDMGPPPKAPEPVVDMGPRQDMPAPVLGEECFVRANTPLDRRSTSLEVQIEIRDLTAGEPIMELADSFAPNFRFDAPLGHEIEFTLSSPNTSIDLVPITKRIVIDQRCAVLDDIEYYMAIGEPIAVLPGNTNTFDELRVAHDISREELYLNYPNVGWRMLRGRINPSPDVFTLTTPPELDALSSGATFHLDADSDRVLVEDAGALHVFVTSVDGLTFVGKLDAQLPLRAVAHDIDGLVLAHDAAGVVLTGSINAQRRLDVDTLATDVAQMLLLEDRAVLLGDDASLTQITPGDGAPEDLGALPADTKRVALDPQGATVVALTGASCAAFSGACTARLLNARDLSPVTDTDGAEVVVEDVVLARRAERGYTIVVQEQSAVVVRLSDAGEATRVEDRALRGPVDPARSAEVTRGIVLGMIQASVLIPDDPAQALVVEPGSWTVDEDTLGTVELLASPCEAWRCDRARYDLSQPAKVGQAFGLTSRRMGSPQDIGDAFEEIVIGSTRLTYNPKVTIAPGLPSGIPCIPALYVETAIDRFTALEEGLICLYDAR